MRPAPSRPRAIARLARRGAPLLLLAACQPKVQLEPPKEPITINLNVKIEHEVLVKVDRDLDQLIEQDKDLF